MNGVSVVSVSETKNPKWRYVTIRHGDPPVQERAICFLGSEADKLVPGPLPDGWSVKPSDKGPVVEAPRRGGGGGGGGGFAAAYRNTKEGHYYEQERMDRRTALMQAVALGTTAGIQVATAGGGVKPETRAATVLEAAELMYGWLRKGANEGT